MQRWQCSMHNGTIETFFLLTMWKILSFLLLSKYLILIIPVSVPAVTEIRKLVLKRNRRWKWSGSKLFSYNCHLCMEGRLKLGLHSFCIEKCCFNFLLLIKYFLKNLSLPLKFFFFTNFKIWIYRTFCPQLFLEKKLFDRNFRHNFKWPQIQSHVWFTTEPSYIYTWVGARTAQMGLVARVDKQELRDFPVSDSIEVIHA